MDKLPKALIQAYKSEFEQTDITIDELCHKYEVDKEQIVGYEEWTKNIVEPQLEQTPVTLVTQENNTLVTIEEESDILDDVENFKKLAMAHAIKFMKQDAEYAEIKEFKDMCKVVLDIEASYKDSKPENQINIAIQNIIKDFKDDC